MFFGWRVVGASFVTQCLTIGTVFYGFGVFFQPLSDEFGWSRAEISWGFSLSAFVGSMGAPFLGAAVDRFGPKPVQMLGAISLGAGFAALSAVDSLAGYYLCTATLIAVGSTALGPMASNAAVAKWFVRSRGRALGFATAGISMGGVVFAGLTQWLIEVLGWRSAFLATGAIVTTVALPVIGLWMVHSPESMGLRPDGDPAPTPEELPTDELLREYRASLTARQAVRTREFWVIALAFGLTIGGLSAILIHQTPYLIDSGLEAATAAGILQATAAVGVLGKLGFGALVDRRDQRYVIIGCFLFQAAGVALLRVADSPERILGYVLLYGYAMGGNATLQATIVGECFGRAHFGAIAGRMLPVIVAIQALSVPTVGWVFDRTGSYDQAFALIIATSLVAALGIFGLRLPERR